MVKRLTRRPIRLVRCPNGNRDSSVTTVTRQRDDDPGTAVGFAARTSYVFFPPSKRPKGLHSPATIHNILCTHIDTLM